jgi:putative transposase
MERRKFTVEQKMAILKEAETEGVTQTLRKHSIYANTIYKWREQFDTRGKEGLKPYQRIDPEVKKLQMENLALKKLLAEKELALSIKDSLLKKVQSKPRIN